MTWCSRFASAPEGFEGLADTLEDHVGFGHARAPRALVLATP